MHSVVPLVQKNPGVEAIFILMDSKTKQNNYAMIYY